MTAGRQSHGTRAVSLQPDLAEVSRGRRFLASVAVEAGFSEERVFDIIVACAEAIANAIEHSPVKGEVEVRALLYPDRLEVEVEGPGEFQAPDRLKERGTRGLGLPLMAKLSDHLALFSGPKGQTFVSLTFYRPGTASAKAGPLPPSFVNLSEENKLLDDVLRHLPDGFYVLDNDWRFVYANPAVLAPLGVETGRLLGRVIWEAFPDFDRQARHALETTREERSVSRITTRSASGLWREWTAFPVEDGIAVFSRDISDRKQAEEALRESEAAVRGILDATQESIWVFDTSGQVVTVNATAARRVGRSPEEIVGKHMAELVPPELAAQRLEQVERVAKTGLSAEFEDERAGIDFVHVLYPIFDREGRVDRVVSFSRDITERKNTARALEVQAELLANVDDPMTATDGDFIITYWNRAAERLFGWTKEEVIGRPGAEVFQTRFPASSREAAVAELFSTGSFKREICYTCKDGSEVPVEVHTALLRDSSGAVTGTVSVQRDISERKQTDHALNKTEERSRLFLQVADAVAEWTDLDKVLEASLSAVVTATSHTRASIGLWDARQQRIMVVASAGAEPVAPSSTPLERFSLPMQEAVRTGRTTLVDYDQLPEDQRIVAESLKARYTLLVPLVYHEEVVGIVLVDDPGERVAFTDEDRELIEGIAAQVAVAIVNAKLFEAQKNIADQLQRTILEMPAEVAGLEFGHLYRSATEEAIVGGDFYDVFERPDGSVVLLAGDVSGHGVNAARVATMVKASLAAFAQSGDEPGAVLANANRLLMRKQVPGFTSVLFAVYSPRTSALRFCSAGHPNLLIGRRDGSVAVVGKNHTPLGVFPDWSCSGDSTEVRSGETVLLYTDGLTEARLGHELFGEQRLSAAFKDRLAMDIKSLPQALLDDVLAFSGGRLQDDVAILAVRPTDRDGGP
jgi:PAS domain S-box-containing protein